VEGRYAFEQDAGQAIFCNSPRRAGNVPGPQLPQQTFDMRLIAVRHGETEWNRERREMGHLDSPLTARGVEQANALARRLRTIAFDALYSSDLGRAIQTAECIASACPKRVSREAGLRERHMGVLQGLTTDESRAHHPSIHAAYARDGFFDTIPDGESARDRRDRSARVCAELAARHPDAMVVAVTHAGFLTGFLESVLDLPPGSGRRFAKHHASFNVFEWRGEAGWRLETWNDIGHLAPLAATS
jgi:probable phosphoglycerate mutase